MKKHTDENIASITCPFDLDIKSIDWNHVKAVVSVDDKEHSIIVEMNDKQRFMIDIPSLLYNAIYKSGEENVIEKDLGFNDLL